MTPAEADDPAPPVHPVHPVASEPSAPPAAPGTRRARVVAVTSGKGGVGKTVFTANLAAALARRGERVLVLDADLGLANVDVVLNLAARTTLHDVFTGRANLDAALCPAPGGFTVLLAGSGLVEYSRLTPEVRDKLGAVVARLRSAFDVVLIDTGAGIADVVLHAVSLADEVVVVATPEPTSLADAYATIKVVASTQPPRPMRLLVNQTERVGQGHGVWTQLQHVVDRYVSPRLPRPLRLALLGDVPFDAAVRDSVARRELLAESLPGSAASQAIDAAAVRLIGGSG